MNNDNENEVRVPRYVATWLLSLSSIAIAGVLGGLIGIGKYMVAWNADDLAFKREVLFRLGRLELVVEAGVLPRTDERLKALENSYKELKEDVDKQADREREASRRSSTQSLSGQ